MEDIRRFVIFVLPRVNHATIHRTRTGKKRKNKAKDKAPRILGPADKTIHIREERLTVQLRGDSEVAGKWINGQHALGQEYNGWPNSEDIILLVEKKNRASYLEDQ